MGTAKGLRELLSASRGRSPTASASPRSPVVSSAVLGTMQGSGAAQSMIYLAGHADVMPMSCGCHVDVMLVSSYLPLSSIEPYSDSG